MIACNYGALASISKESNSPSSSQTECYTCLNAAFSNCWPLSEIRPVQCALFNGILSSMQSCTFVLSAMGRDAHIALHRGEQCNKAWCLMLVKSIMGRHSLSSLLPLLQILSYHNSCTQHQKFYRSHAVAMLIIHSLRHSNRLTL